MELPGILLIGIIVFGILLLSKVNNVQKENSELKTDMGNVVNAFVTMTKQQKIAAAQRNQKPKEEKKPFVLPKYKFQQEEEKKNEISKISPNLAVQTQTHAKIGEPNSEAELTAMFA